MHVAFGRGGTSVSLHYTPLTLHTYDHANSHVVVNLFLVSNWIIIIFVQSNMATVSKHDSPLSHAATYPVSTKVDNIILS